MATKKYEITKVKYQHFEFTLFQIRALKDFGKIKAGQLGGFVHSEQNLSHEGDCWIWPECLVYLNAKVLDDAQAKGGWIWNNARLRDEAVAADDAFISADADIYGKALVKDFASCTTNCKVFDKAVISQKGGVGGRAWIHGKAEVSGAARASGDVDLEGTFKLRGNALIYEGHYDKGVLEYYSPFVTDLARQG